MPTRQPLTCSTGFEAAYHPCQGRILILLNRIERLHNLLLKALLVDGGLLLQLHVVHLPYIVGRHKPERLNTTGLYDFLVSNA